MRGARANAMVRWGATALSVLLVLLYIANVPFYSGSRVGATLMWRMEHGRLRVERKSQGVTESFFIAFNSEGLRFAPELRWTSSADWMVQFPLWMPLGVTGGVAGWAWRGWWRARGERATGGGRCGGCGYELSGLRVPAGAGAAVCPECGKAKATDGAA